ncbi:MAG: caspase family protein [Rhodospirillaceae bacterium]
MGESLRKVALGSGAALVALAVGLAGAAVAPPPVARAATGNEFLVVDCLLPAQIRKMGRSLTFTAPRQAIRTTGQDCEARGGEYVSFDRADYGTSLKIWLEQAASGNADAANNVGQVFENGFRDYASAAQWYRRAAESGDNRAKINLGLLYERGLGVPQDMQAALTWYRSAAGVDAAIVTNAAANAQSQATIDTLQREVDSLRAELGAAQSSSRSLQAALDERTRRADANRREVDRLRASLNSRQAPAAPDGDAQARLSAAEQQLKAKEQQLAAVANDLKQREAAQAALRRQLAENEKTISAQKAQLASLTQDSRGDERERTRRAAELREREADVAALRKRLADQEAVASDASSAVGASRREADQLRREVSKLEKDIASLRARPDRSADLAKLEDSLRKREAELAGNRTEIADLRTKIAAADRQTKEYQAKLAKLSGEDAAAARTVRGEAAERKSLIRTSKLISSVKFGSYHALVIGNSRYKELPKLNTTVADARVVSDLLRQKYGFKVTTLIDADRYQTLSAINKYRETLTEDDNLVIYYAGHGELDTVNQRGYWLPIDAEKSSNANWISATAITDILNVMTARHVLVVSDSCYSGILTRSVLSNMQPGQNLDAQAAWVAAIVKKRSRTVLTSGGVAPVIDGGGGEHSVFARAFIDILSANDDILPAQKLHIDVSRRVNYVTANLRVDQVPVYAPLPHAGHDLGEFLFVPNEGAREASR